MRRACMAAQAPPRFFTVDATKKNFLGEEMLAVLALHHLDDGGCFVDYVAVRTDRRREGHGQRLFASLPSPIHLICRPLSKAMFFYEAIGFKTIMHEEPYMPGIGEISMRRDRVGSHELDTGERWSHLPVARQAETIAFVRGIEKITQRAAERLLKVEDPRMQYMFVDDHTTAPLMTKSKSSHL